MFGVLMGLDPTLQSSSPKKMKQLTLVTIRFTSGNIGAGVLSATLSVNLLGL